MRRRAVVLIVEHEVTEGTLGVVLNRPTKIPVGQVLEQWTELATDPSVLFRGGPVAPNSALGLASVPGQEYLRLLRRNKALRKILIPRTELDRFLERSI